MNRIILIGNGFDLAHGMKTSYTDFLDDLWNNFKSDLIKNRSNHPVYVSFNNDLIKVSGTKSIGGFYTEDEDINGYEGFRQYVFKYGLTFEIKNNFLSTISLRRNLNNWVEIENEYYQQLNAITEDRKGYERIDALNADFRRIQELLEEYLNRQQKAFGALNNDSKLFNEIGRKIYAPINYSDFTEAAVSKRLEEEFTTFQNNKKSLMNLPSIREYMYGKYLKVVDHFENNESSTQSKKSDLRNLLRSEEATDFFKLTPEKVLFLNFNYTDIDELYKNPKAFENYDPAVQISVAAIRIHGSLGKSHNNPIIFGYGDEIDENYKEIEKLNDNRYLENIKSIKYLETDNYKKLLEFINADDYQMFLFGHSCGVSDRTLLNTLFEHPNCVSIKPFYHQKNPEHDNYSDLVRNISRNFNKKAEMRSKVVNKTYCEPLVKLPQ